MPQIRQPAPSVISPQSLARALILYTILSVSSPNPPNSSPLSHQNTLVRFLVQVTSATNRAMSAFVPQLTQSNAQLTRVKSRHSVAKAVAQQTSQIKTFSSYFNSQVQKINSIAAELTDLTSTIIASMPPNANQSDYPAALREFRQSTHKELDALNSLRATVASADFPQFPDYSQACQNLTNQLDWYAYAVQLVLSHADAILFSLPS